MKENNVTYAMGDPPTKFRYRNVCAKNDMDEFLSTLDIFQRHWDELQTGQTMTLHLHGEQVSKMLCQCKYCKAVTVRYMLKR